MRTARLIMVALFVLGVSAVAVAQDAKPIENSEFGVVITPPAKWEVTQGNDKAIANFKHQDSPSQIEVVGTKLLSEDVADVFFSTFHKTLVDSNFEEISKESATIGDVEGQQTSYKFTHSEVTLEVVVFEFLKDTTAWLVVGYMEESDKEGHLEDLKSVVSNMTFSES